MTSTLITFCFIEW